MITKLDTLNLKKDELAEILITNGILELEDIFNEVKPEKEPSIFYNPERFNFKSKKL